MAGGNDCTNYQRLSKYGEENGRRNQNLQEYAGPIMGKAGLANQPPATEQLRLYPGFSTLNS